MRMVKLGDSVLHITAMAWCISCACSKKCQATACCGPQELQNTWSRGAYTLLGSAMLF